MNNPVSAYGVGRRRRLFLPVLLAFLGMAWLGGPRLVGAAEPLLAAVPSPDPAGFAGTPAKGKSGRAEDGLRVELVKSAPSDGTLRVGGAASFEAKVLDGTRPVRPEDYVCRWKSDAGARFLEAEGPFGNTAVFVRPGRQRVWVEVVPRTGPSKGLSAVSEPVDLEVANPVFALSVTPPAPLVGEEVTVVIRDFPLHDGVEFRWDPLPAKAKLVSVSERGLTYYPTEAGTVPVRVAASMSGSGQVLGTATVSVVAKPYVVAVEDKGLAEAPATVWRDGAGPVAADGVAVGQKVALRATVSPASRHPPLRFTWQLCPGARSEGGSSARDILASRREVGPCAVSVEVRDARDLLLGRGEGAFAVAVSQAELDAATDNVRETARLVEAAGQAWRDGEVDRAWDTAARAARLNPSDQGAAAALERIVREKKRLDALLDRARQALAGDDFDEVAAMLDESGKVNPRAVAIGAIARAAAARKDVLAKVGRMLAEARKKWDAGAVDAALSLADRALALDPGHAGARAERERMVAGRGKLIAALKQSAGFLAGKRFESAAAALGEARAVNARFPAIAEMDAAIAARRERAWRLDERLARARDQWNAGDADGALGTLTEAAALDPEQTGAGQAGKTLAEAREKLLGAEDRAEAALGRGKLDEARAALDEARKLNPRHGRLAELDAAVAARADRDRRLAGLKAEAAKRREAGDLDGAVQALDDMLALSPGDAALVAERNRLARTRDAVAEALRRGRDYLADRRYDLALSALGEAEKGNPRLPGLVGLRRHVLAEKAKAEEAATTWLAEARRLLDKKDYAGADKALVAAKNTGSLPQALERQVREARSRVEAGLVGQEAARKEQAAREAGAGRAADADRRARCEDVGREAAAKRRQGDHAGAIRSYQTLLNLCPDTCQAYNNVGASLYSLGYVAEAVPWFDEAVKCGPGERLFRENAAMTRARLAEKAGPGTETARQCAAAFETAESRRNAGNLPEAIDGYRTVVAKCPDFCAAYNNLGLSLHKLGRPGEALPLFEQALRCNPKENLFRENYDLTAKRLRAASGRP